MAATSADGPWATESGVKNTVGKVEYNMSVSSTAQLSFSKRSQNNAADIAVQWEKIAIDPGRRGCPPTNQPYRLALALALRS
jgi:hypothetical protein